MIRSTGRGLAAIVAATSLIATAYAARVGEPAPDFTVKDSKGRQHRLADYKGKVVVLEWHNQGCPYVKKQYDSGNMQRLQKDWTAKGVVWLTVISSAPGLQGYVTPAEADAYVQQKNAAPSAVLLDPTGVMGRAYDAKTSPHMFVIDKEGRLAYNGAIDDKPTTDLADVPGAKNYVSEALTAVFAGQPVPTTTTKPYGCSVKYAAPSE
jgi:peroxiredoxin